MADELPGAVKVDLIAFLSFVTLRGYLWCTPRAGPIKAATKEPARSIPVKIDGDRRYSTQLTRKGNLGPGTCNPRSALGAHLTESARGRRRLACYGWVDEHAGSVASGGYVVLHELLRRGVEIDLYAHRAHIPPPPRLVSAGFRYFGFDQPRSLDVFDRVPEPAGGAIRRLLTPLVRARWRRVYEPTARAEHKRAKYDAVLTLGTTPAFTLAGTPHVTWVQAPFHTELEAVRRLREQIVSVSGRPFYALLVAYYGYKRLISQRFVIPSEHLIVGSSWSRDALLSTGAPADSVHALPYPVDLETFRPGPAPNIDWERPVLLSLGRLDPRKRLDLLLDAFARVRGAIPGARLRIVGYPGYAPNQLSLLGRFPFREAIEYRAAVPRQEVPSLLREAAVLVQASENENFGSAVAEALACGTPVVVGPTNGTADYIDGISRVFGGYSPQPVADSILDVLASRRRQPDEVRGAARDAAERWFAAPVVADRLLQIIEEAIAAQA